MISKLSIKFAIIAMLAMTVIALSIPVMATVSQSGCEQELKDCSTADGGSNIVCVPDTPVVLDGSQACNVDDSAPGVNNVDVGCTPSDGACGIVTIAVTHTDCPQTVNSCDRMVTEDQSTDRMVKDDQICDGAPTTDKICNGSKPIICPKTTAKTCPKTTDAVCNGSKTITCPKTTAKTCPKTTNKICNGSKTDTVCTGTVNSLDRVVKDDQICDGATATHKTCPSTFNTPPCVPEIPD